MADKNFRAYRGRDAFGAADPASWAASDPLAELARLIGQIDPVGERSRNSTNTPTGPVADRTDWQADEGDDEPDRYAQSVDVQPRFVESYRERSYTRHDRDDDQDALPGLQYSGQASFDDERTDAPQDDRYRDDRLLPALAPQSTDVTYETDQQWRDGAADEQSYDVAEYDDAVPDDTRRRRIGVALAIVGLVALGGAGAYGYHTMFGGSILPSLPPIIKAGNGPNRIIPSHSNAQADASSPTDSTNSTGAKLVPREEQPLDIQAPPGDGPRVISTIPILPDAGAASQGAPVVPPASAGPQSSAAAAPPSPAPAASASGPTMTSAPVLTGTAPDTAMLPEPRKVHTVIIREDQPGGAEEASASARPQLPAASQAPADVPARRVVKRSTSQSAANAPLELVPEQTQGFPPPPPASRTRIARAEPANGPLALQPSATAAAAAAPLGGYSVQVSSQRSEQEARAAFRSLQAKYPDQLGNREPIIRRADLGAKGTYYRTLVGPFASVEEAAAMCSKLKSAGGSCLVERN